MSSKSIMAEVDEEGEEEEDEEVPGSREKRCGRGKSAVQRIVPRELTQKFA